MLNSIRNNSNYQPPFGMLIKERAYTSDSYRFGFGGQEKDDEVSGTGNSMTAEFWQYDSRLGRRWNVDPVEKPSFSNYTAFSNNPLVFIDPEGNTDYYNSGGKWIGTDGNTNGINAIVTHSKVEREISRASRKGKNFKAELPNEAFFKLPSLEVLNATVQVFDAQKRPFGDDGEGGYHEVATYFNEEGCQSPILHGEDVLTSDKVRQAQGADVRIDGPKAPNGFEKGKVSIHSHPTKTIKYFNLLYQKEFIYGPTANSPSEGFDDIAFENYDLNIIVGKDKEGAFETETANLSQGISQRRLKEVYRSDSAYFFDRNSQHLFDASIDSLRSISNGDGKKASKSYKKYEKKNK